MRAWLPNDFLGQWAGRRPGQLPIRHSRGHSGGSALGERDDRRTIAELVTVDPDDLGWSSACSKMPSVARATGSAESHSVQAGSASRVPSSSTAGSGGFIPWRRVTMATKPIAIPRFTLTQIGAIVRGASDSCG